MTIRLAMAILLPVGVTACGTKVMVPPRIDLQQHQVIGIVEFTSTNEGELGPLTTRRFMQAMREDQGLVRIVELGTEADVLASIGRQRLDQAALQALGERRGLRTIITGALTISDVRPDIRIGPGLIESSVAAEVDAELAVWMNETATGATLWNKSAQATRRVGQVRIAGGGSGNVVFDARSPEGAYDDLVWALVDVTSRDYRVSWVRQ